MYDKIREALASLEASRAIVRDRAKKLVAAVRAEQRAIEKQIMARPDPGWLKSDPELDRLQTLHDDFPTPEVDQLTSKEIWEDDVLGPLKRFLRANR